MPLTVGSSTAERPRFLFDLASASCWLVAERIMQVMPVATEWVPVHLPALREGEGFRCAEEEQIWRASIERRAAQLGLQPVRWPPRVPFDSEPAMLAATYAKGTGRAVAFALAAFRQAWCGGRALDEPDNVAIAGAACELHPKALIKGAELRSTREALARASAGVDAVPAIRLPGGDTFVGEDAPERAAAVAGSRTGGGGPDALTGVADERIAACASCTAAAPGCPRGWRVRGRSTASRSPRSRRRRRSSSGTATRAPPRGWCASCTPIWPSWRWRTSWPSGRPSRPKTERAAAPGRLCLKSDGRMVDADVEWTTDRRDRASSS